MSEEEIALLKVVGAEILLISIIIGTFIFFYIRHQKRIIAMQKQLLTAEIQTLEKERRRIAEDLHDDMAPLLTSVIFNLDILNPSSEEEINVVENSVAQLNYAVNEIRNISHNLAPATLAREGLIEAVKKLACQLNRPGKTDVTFATDVVKASIDKEKELNLYRVMEEIITNALKHASATKIDINIMQNNGMYIVKVHDDGVGFDFNSAKERSSGLGLKNIQSRVSLVNGHLDYRKEKKGTLVTIEIPYHNE